MIPWVLSDTNYVRGPHQSWTVFVGGLHGMLNAGRYNLTTGYFVFGNAVKYFSQ